MATTETWTDTDRCPFCGDRLASPGVGFVVHVREESACEEAFETWRERVTEDVAGGWGG